MLLSKNAQHVQDVLHKKGVDTKVVELPASTHTAADAAKAIDCIVGQIVKSLIFRTKHTNRPILVLASGANRVSEKLVALAVGEEITKAEADFAREITGFPIGGIPPLGHKEKIETFIDEDLLQFEQLWAAAGTSNAVFSIGSAAIVEVTNGKVIVINNH